MATLLRAAGALVLVPALALGLASVWMSTATAAVPYDAEFVGESAPLTLAPGQSGVFVALFRNTGAKTWSAGADQVNLAVCAATGGTCGVTSPNAAWASGWTSGTAYATHATPVLPGQIGIFVYQVQAPATAKIGTPTRFNGELVVAATGQPIRPMGYYQEATAALAPGTAAVSADLSEYKIGLSVTTVTAATTSFRVRNAGKLIHELLVVKTDLAPDQLPLDAAGNVDEAKVTFVGKQEDIDPGDTRDLTLNLAPGKYVLICNQPGHYKAGMRLAFSVAAPIAAGLSEYKITPTATDASAGVIDFNVKNSGTLIHELLVVKTDLAPDQLPLDAAGNVDEAKVTFVGKQEDIDPGDTRDLTLNLAPGKYVLICNQPGHYKAGMRLAFTVR